MPSGNRKSAKAQPADGRFKNDTDASKRIITKRSHSLGICAYDTIVFLNILFKYMV